MVDRMAAEASFSKKVFSALGTWLAAVRDAVRRSWLKIKGAPDIHVVASTEPLWLRLLADLEGELKVIYNGEFVSVLGLDKTHQASLVDNILAESRINLARIPTEIQNDLQRLISSQVQAGKTPTDIEKAVNDFLDINGSENWPGRAKTIAVTEVHRMANAATQAAGIAIEGIEQTALKKTWIARHDDRVRRTHVEADGQSVPMNSVFHVGDSLMLYPGDPNAPAGEVVNCRCSMKIQDRKVAR